MREDTRFAAFISYSHRDAKWAAWLQRALERYRLPAQVAREANLARRIGSVFRDREELTAGSNLGEHLLDALGRSDALIVICSPNAIQSQWVGAEIEHFKSLGKAHRIFCLLVDGGAEAFPEPLLTDTEGNALEPLAADPRDHADGKRLARLKLIAGLLDLRLDQLARRDLQRQRQLRAVYLSLGVMFTAVSVGAYWNWLQQRQEAREGLAVVCFVSNKWDELRSVKGLPLHLMIDLAEEPLGYLQQRLTRSLDTGGLDCFAKLLRQQGIAYMDQEDGSDKSLSVLKQSLDIYQQLSDESPDNTHLLYELGLAHYWVGANRLYDGDYESALAPIKAYNKLMATVNAIDPENISYTAENVYRQTMRLELKRSAPHLLPELNSENLLAETVAAAKHAIGRFPDALDILEAHMGALIFAKRIHNETCDVKKALPLAEAALSSSRQRVAIEQQMGRAGIETRKDLASLESEVGHVYTAVGRPADARRDFLTAYALRSNIAIEDPTNQYMAEMVFANGLDLFRLDFLAPRDTPPTTLEAQILDSLVGTDVIDHDLPPGLAAAWYKSRAEKALASGQVEEAASALREFKSFLPNLEQGLAKIHNQWSAYWLSKELEPEAGDPIPQNLEQAGLSDVDQTCRGQEVTWNWHLANGNTQAADAIAKSLWDKGYRRPRMAFYAKLAGTTYPPEGVTTP